MHQSDLFTDHTRLFDDLCSMEALRVGFHDVKKNQGSPGVDGMTITDFETRLDEELAQRREDLVSWHYQPDGLTGNYCTGWMCVDGYRWRDEPCTRPVRTILWADGGLRPPSDPMHVVITDNSVALVVLRTDVTHER